MPARKEIQSVRRHVAAWTIAKMPTLMASGSVAQVSTTTANRGSIGAFWHSSAPHSAPLSPAALEFPPFRWGSSIPAPATCFLGSETRLPSGYTKSHRPRTVAFFVSTPSLETLCGMPRISVVSLARSCATFDSIKFHTGVAPFGPKVSAVSESLLHWVNGCSERSGCLSGGKIQVSGPGLQLLPAGRPKYRRSHDKAAPCHAQSVLTSAKTPIAAGSTSMNDPYIQRHRYRSVTPGLSSPTSSLVTREILSSGVHKRQSPVGRSQLNIDISAYPSGGV